MLLYFQILKGDLLYLKSPYLTCAGFWHYINSKREFNQVKMDLQLLKMLWRLYPLLRPQLSWRLSLHEDVESDEMEDFSLNCSFIAMIDNIYNYLISTPIDNNVQFEEDMMNYLYEGQFSENNNIMDMDMDDNNSKSLEEVLANKVVAIFNEMSRQTSMEDKRYFFGDSFGTDVEYDYILGCVFKVR